MNLQRVWISGILFFATIGSASAELVTWTVRGHVGSITDPGAPASWAAGVAVGAPIELVFHADTSVPPSFSLPSLGITTFDLQGATLDLGSLHFDLTYNSLALSDDPATVPTSYNLGGISISPQFSVTVQLGSSQDLIPNFNFPSALPALSSFDLVSSISIMESGPSNERWEAIGSVSELQTSSSPVPESSTYGLFAALSAVALCAVRRYRTQAGMNSPRA
jgi:hypothetical protein